VGYECASQKLTFSTTKRLGSPYGGRKIGHEGGQKGSGDALNKIKIAVEEGTSNVVTAFSTR
jgi:hypothetical protein